MPILDENIRLSITGKIADLLTTEGDVLTVSQIQRGLDRDFNTFVTREEIEATLSYMRNQPNDPLVRDATGNMRIKCFKGEWSIV